MNKTVYIAICINLECIKWGLRIWIGENEISKYWLKVLIDARNMGIKDVLIAASIDRLVEFSNAVKAVFPDT
ncbi:TPA: transposase [Clostridioides difficile]|nr:transposase [Clostridioides difficile]